MYIFVVSILDQCFVEVFVYVLGEEIKILWITCKPVSVICFA